MLRPKALDHVGLKVTDMEKSLHFYQTLELLRDIRSEGRQRESSRMTEGRRRPDAFMVLA